MTRFLQSLGFLLLAGCLMVAAWLEISHFFWVPDATEYRWIWMRWPWYAGIVASGVAGVCLLNID